MTSSWLEAPHVIGVGYVADGKGISIGRVITTNSPFTGAVIDETFLRNRSGSSPLRIWAGTVDILDILGSVDTFYGDGAGVRINRMLQLAKISGTFPAGIANTFTVYVKGAGPDLTVRRGTGAELTVLLSDLLGVASGIATLDSSGLIPSAQRGGAESVASTATMPAPTRQLVNVGGTTNITSVTAGVAGQRVTLKFAGALTVTDGSNLKLAGDFVTTAADTLTMICDGTDWYETSRSVN